MIDDAESFETHRPALLALAYRMLGDMARAEDTVQEAWVRWQNRRGDVEAPKAFLLTTVTRLCLDELGSARARREESRSDRLPEPVDLDPDAALMAFVRAVTGGEQEVLLKLLAEDAVLIADAGPGGARYGRIRNVGRPIVGRTKIAALMRASARQKVPPAEIQERVLNGEPAAVAFRDGRAVAAFLISVADGKIRHVFMQTDPERLRHVGPLN